MADRRLLLLAALAILAGCGKPAPKPAAAPVLNFSILSAESSQSQLSHWRPYLDDMQKATGLTVKPFFASNYASLIEAMRFKQIDVGWFSNQSGLEAVRRSGGEVFARTTGVTGTEGYQSVILVRKGSGLTLERIMACDRSLDFGMGDAKSTSGTLAPMTYLFAPRRLTPSGCFKSARTANHESNLFAVANGVLDAATNNTNSMGRMARQDTPLSRQALARVEIVWRSPTIPKDPMVWRKDLDPAVKAKVRAFMLGYGRAEGAEGERQRKVLAGIDTGPLKAADDSHLWPVRQMEATERLVEARAANDAAAAAAAQATLAQIEAEQAQAR